MNTIKSSSPKIEMPKLLSYSFSLKEKEKNGSLTLSI